MDTQCELPEMFPSGFDRAGRTTGLSVGLLRRQRLGRPFPKLDANDWTRAAVRAVEYRLVDQEGLYRPGARATAASSGAIDGRDIAAGGGSM